MKTIFVCVYWTSRTTWRRKMKQKIFLVFVCIRYRPRIKLFNVHAIFFFFVPSFAQQWGQSSGPWAWTCLTRKLNHYDFVCIVCLSDESDQFIHLSFLICEKSVFSIGWLCSSSDRPSSAFDVIPFFLRLIPARIWWDNNDRIECVFFSAHTFSDWSLSFYVRVRKNMHTFSPVIWLHASGSGAHIAAHSRVYCVILLNLCQH